MSKSILSRRVARLEEQLGARLLTRTAKGAQPTDIGQAYFERASNILVGPRGGAGGGRRGGDPDRRPDPDERPALLRHRISGARACRFRQGASPRRARCLARGPQGRSRRRRLRSGRADRQPARFRAHRPPHRARPCGGARQPRLSRRARYARASARPRRARPPDSTPISARRSNGASGSMADGRISAASRGSAPTMASCCAKPPAPASASSLLPTFIASPAIQAGKLQVILRDYPLEESALHVVMPPGRATTARVRALVDFLAERFGPEPDWDPCWMAGEPWLRLDACWAGVINDQHTCRQESPVKPQLAILLLATASLAACATPQPQAAAPLAPAAAPVDPGGRGCAAARLPRRRVRRGDRAQPARR